MGKKNNNFIIQGSILALAGIVTRMIGIIYRIPLNNILGNKGSSAYSIAFDIYSLFLLISSLSLPLAVSKLVSKRLANGEYRNVKKAFVGSLLFGILLGLPFSLILYFFSGKLAYLWKFPSAEIAIKVLAPTLFIMCILGVMRGFFQGMGTMIPTALSQIFEQIVNAVVSIVAAIILWEVGDKVHKAASYSAAGGTLGTALGALTALLFMVFVYFLYRPSFNKKVRRDKFSRDENFNDISKILVFTIIPVLLSTTIYNLSGILDSAIFGNIMSSVFNLKESDYSGFWGIYSNRYRLLTTAPIAIASALSAAIIPSLIKSISQGDFKLAKVKITKSIKVTLLVSIPCGMGLTLLAGPIIDLIFPGPDLHNESIYLLRYSILTVFVYSFSTITNSILQGLDMMKQPVIHSAISLIAHIFILPILMLFFKLNIYAVVIADIIFALMVCIMNLFAIKRRIHYKQEMMKTIILPLFASGVMGITVYFIQKLIRNIIPGGIATLIAIFLAVIIYFALLLMLRVIKEDEILMLPKGRKLVVLLKKYKVLK